MPGLGLPVSNRRSPSAYRRTVPKRRMRAISSGVSTGNICARRASIVGKRGEVLMTAMLLGFLQQFFEPPVHFLARLAEGVQLFVLRAADERRILERPVVLDETAGRQRASLFRA